MSISNLISQLFAGDSLQFWWYLTRAAGLAGYFLLWLSTAWGMVVSSKILDSVVERAFTYDFHEYLSLLGLGFIFVHVAVLMLDKYLPYTIWQVVIPFLSPYRSFWVGIGVIAFYISLIVTVTYYLRSRIGMKAFRMIHYASLAGYLGATLHGLYAGTDSVLPLVNLSYKVTFLITLFLVVYWVIMLWMRRQEEEKKRKEAMRAARRNKGKRPAVQQHRSIA